MPVASVCDMHTQDFCFNTEHVSDNSFPVHRWEETTAPTTLPRSLSPHNVANPKPGGYRYETTRKWLYILVEIRLTMSDEDEDEFTTKVGLITETR